VNGAPPLNSSHSSERRPEPNPTTYV
jgi:hypothetical protein